MESLFSTKCFNRACLGTIFSIDSNYLRHELIRQKEKKKASGNLRCVHESAFFHFFLHLGSPPKNMKARDTSIPYRPVHDLKFCSVYCWIAVYSMCACLKVFLSHIVFVYIVQPNHGSLKSSLSPSAMISVSLLCSSSSFVTSLCNALHDLSWNKSVYTLVGSGDWYDKGILGFLQNWSYYQRQVDFIMMILRNISLPSLGNNRWVTFEPLHHPGNSSASPLPGIWVYQFSAESNRNAWWTSPSTA